MKSIQNHINKYKYILNYIDDWDDNGALSTNENIFNKASDFIKLNYEYIKKIYKYDLVLPEIDILRDGSISVLIENKKSSILIIFKNESEDCYYYGENKNEKSKIKGNTKYDKIDNNLIKWLKNNI